MKSGRLTVQRLHRRVSADHAFFALGQHHLIEEDYEAPVESKNWAKTARSCSRSESRSTNYAFDRRKVDPNTPVGKLKSN